MTVKTSVSLRDDHYAFAEELVRRGRFNSVSAVIQYGLEQMRDKDEAAQKEHEAFLAFIRRRAGGHFISEQAFDARFENMLAKKARAWGLDDIADG